MSWADSGAHPGNQWRIHGMAFRRRQEKSGMGWLRGLTLTISVLCIISGAAGLAYLCFLLFAPPSMLQAFSSLARFPLVPFTPSSVSVVQSAGGTVYFVTRPGPAIFICTSGLLLMVIGIVRWWTGPVTWSRITIWLGAALILMSNLLSPLTLYPSMLLIASICAILVAIMVALQSATTAVP